MSEVIKKPVHFSDTGVQLSSIEEAYRFAEAVVASGVGGTKNASEVMIKMQTGMELGFPPMASFKHIHVINGVPSLAVEACVALVEKNKGLAPGTKIRKVFSGDRLTDNWACTVYSTPRGGEEISSEPMLWSSFKHLHGGNVWKKYPDRMFGWRSVGYHIKDYYPAFLFGVHVAEDVEDYSPRQGETRLVNPGKQRDAALDFISEPEVVGVDEAEEESEPVDDEFVPDVETVAASSKIIGDEESPEMDSDTADWLESYDNEGSGK